MKREKLKAPARPRPRGNFGAGALFDFHGAFKTKAAAVAKEQSTPGAFIKGVLLAPGDYRYLVLTRKASNPGKKILGKKKTPRRKGESVEAYHLRMLREADARMPKPIRDMMYNPRFFTTPDGEIVHMFLRRGKSGWHVLTPKDGKYLSVAGPYSTRKEADRALLSIARKFGRGKTKNPLFTRGEKRRFKKKIKGAARRGLMRLFGGAKKKSQAGKRHRGTARETAGARGEVISALVNQGYSRSQAAAMTPAAQAGEIFDSLFRRALKKNPSLAKDRCRCGHGHVEHGRTGACLHTRDGHVCPCKRFQRGRRRGNPESLAQSQEDLQAIQAFREFHGADPDRVTEVIERMVEQGKFWLVGRLLGYDLHQFPLYRDEHDRNRRPNVDCWPANIMLCADPPRDPKDKLGRQLFLYGGNQDMEWALAEHFDIRSNVQIVVLGTIDRIWYVTRKSIHNFQVESYVHRFGEDGGEKPLLLYDRLKKKQWIVGGDYTITDRGIEH